MNLWGGRFTGSSDAEAASFNSSIAFDRRLYRHDILGSIAHAKMLGRQGIIPEEDAKLIEVSLNGILADIESGDLQIDMAAEDIHSFVEGELVARIGDAGRRLHTGRSRNDQVALDMRMYVRDEIDAVSALLIKLMKTLTETAKTHDGTIMPGFTHMQKAQPVTLGHHLMAYFQMFRRDVERLGGCLKRTNVMPLGSGALASAPYPLDRTFVMKELGFSSITENSMDAVSDRDFCIEFASCLSIIMMHLSRFCEELVIWSADAFGFVEISDAYATGSSIMPQKKNPDMAELIRGKTGRVYGCLLGLLTMMKGLPLAYNKDMQEDKEAVFGAADSTKACLAVFAGMFGSLSFNAGAMHESAQGGYTNATDAADWLVKKGVPFREAHEITGRLVLYAISVGKPLGGLTVGELKAVSDVFDESLFECISAESCIKARNLPGGPGKGAMAAAVAEAERFLMQSADC